MIERRTEQIYKFILPGPALSGHETEAIEAAIADAIGEGDHVLASGSLPIGIPTDFYGRIAAIAEHAGARLMLDTHGEALERALGRNLFMIKPNWRELDALVGAERELGDPSRREDAARLVADGRAQVVALTEGELGAFVASAEGSFEITPPEVPAISPVGGGDAFAGATLLALSRGDGLEEACRLGSAAAAAAVGTVGTAAPSRSEVERILADVRVGSVGATGRPAAGAR